MARQEVVDLLNRVRRLHDLVERYPLGAARLWDRPAPLTSQRRAVEDMAEDVQYVRGGKGSGKTEMASQIAAATVRGRNDAEARWWAQRNGYPLERLPRWRSGDNDVVIASAVSHDLSLSVHRPSLRRYLPRATRYSYWEAKTEATADVPNGGKLITKAGRQGRAAYQSFKSPLVWLDEEHEKDIADECKSRVARCRLVSGLVLLTATPVTALRDPRMAWIHDQFEVEVPEGYRSVVIRGSDSPWLNKAKRARLLASMSEADRRMEEEGAYHLPGGRVWWAWNEQVHVVPSMQIPHTWPRWGALDIGTSAPTAYVAFAYDAEHDQVHAYGVHYAREKTTAMHAKAIKQLHADLGEVPPRTIKADMNTPEIAQVVLDYRNHGLRFTPANKAYSLGITVTNDYLQVHTRGVDRIERPGFVVHDSCPIIGREAATHAWKPEKVAIDGYGPRSTRGPDHALDACRYGLLYARHSFSGRGGH